MPVLSVQYDLYKEPGRVYAELIDSLEEFPAWCRPTESSWLIETDLTPQQVVVHLKPHLHKMDKLLVVPVAPDQGWRSWGLSEEVAEWVGAALQIRRAG
jgi:hypothetical protein